MKYFSSLKRRKIVAHSILWTNFKNMVNETGSLKKANTVLFHLHYVSEVEKIHRNRKLNCGCKGLQGGIMESCCLMGIEF